MKNLFAFSPSRLFALGIAPLLIAFFALSETAIAAKPERLAIAYHVAVERAGQPFATVEMDVRGLDRPTLDVAIPAWTPGSYEILNYAQYLSLMEAKGAGQKPCSLRFLDKQTWRIETAGQEQITIRYRVRCERLTVDSNWLGPHYGQLQGAATFLYLPSDRSLPSTVDFRLPAGWNVAMPLTETPPKTFTAASYDALVDAPMILGEYVRVDFPIRQTQVSIITVRTPANPKGLREALSKIVEVYAEMMGGLPFERYFFCYVPHDEEDPNGAFTEGLEHANSTLINYSPVALIDHPENAEFLTVTAHEFFHAWNVKRLRPRELVAATYAQEAYTPSLWFAEGVTDYYAMLGLVRAGLIHVEDFTAYVAHNLEVIENGEAQKYLSLEDASISTWLTGTSSFQDIPVDYYGKGALVGLLLDIEIRTKSGGTHSLDDLMRALVKKFPENSSGYSGEDLVAETNRLAETDVSDFFRRYVHGTDALPARDFLNRLGFNVAIEKAESAYQGYELDFESDELEVVTVLPDTPATRAGLEEGDILVKINNQMIRSQGDYATATANMKPGTPIKLKINRNGEPLTLTLTPTARTEADISVTIQPNPSSAQLQLRRAIFHLPATATSQLIPPTEAHVVWWAAAGFKPVVSLRE